METQAATEIPISATVKVPESLWRRAKIEAIRRGCTLSELVEGLLDEALREKKATK